MTSQMKRKTCETCGLSLSGSEYDHAWDKIRDQGRDEENQKRRRDREYLKWYESKKE
ncbi:MAG: hypothetical protein ACTSYI_06875 [Promethearchaeota archaeon]